LNTPTTTDPPYVPIRRSGWPVRRTPLWLVLAVLLIAGGVALISLTHKPSHAEQAADLTGYVNDMNAAVESCAGGVTESQQALSAVESGATAELKTAVSLVNYDAANCSPANSQPLADLTQYQVTESLDSFNLENCTNDFVTWAFDAVPVQTDMVSVMTARSAAARTKANAALQRDLRKLNAERGTIYSILRSAEHTVSDHSALPSLPG
jgi:ABC-type Na+ efflux pump permease subunit